MKYSLSLFRAAQAIKPHVPLIKFRRAQQEHNISSIPTVSKGTPTSSGGHQYLIDERQLPKRFRRQAIDEHEITAVNTGGAI